MSMNKVAAAGMMNGTMITSLITHQMHGTLFENRLPCDRMKAYDSLLLTVHTLVGSWCYFSRTIAHKGGWKL